MTSTSTYARAVELLAGAIARSADWATLTGLSDPTDLAARVLRHEVEAADVPPRPYCAIFDRSDAVRHTRVGVGAFAATAEMYVLLEDDVAAGDVAAARAAKLAANETAGKFLDLLKNLHAAVADDDGTLLVVREAALTAAPDFLPRSEQSDGANAAERWCAIFSVKLGDEL